MIVPNKLKNKNFKYQFQKKIILFLLGFRERFLILTYDYDTLDDKYDLEAVTKLLLFQGNNLIVSNSLSNIFLNIAHRKS